MPNEERPCLLYLIKLFLAQRGNLFWLNACYIKSVSQHRIHSSSDDMMEERITEQASDVVDNLTLLRRERSKLKGGCVVKSCDNVLRAIATLTKTLVDLEFMILDIKNREQNVSVVSLSLETRKPTDDAAAVNEPSAKLSTHPPPPVETFCMR